LKGMSEDLVVSSSAAILLIILLSLDVEAFEEGENGVRETHFDSVLIVNGYVLIWLWYLFELIIRKMLCDLEMKRLLLWW